MPADILSRKECRVKGKIFYVGVAIVVIVIVVVAGLDYFAPGVRGSGVLKTETLDLESFDHVTFEGVGTARIHVGEPQLIQITTDDNLFPLLEIRVEEGNLIIRSVQEIRPTKLLLAIRVPDLSGVALAGNPTVEVADLARDSFRIGITGHGTAEVSGRTDRLTAKITGNGLARATGLVARRAEVDITGAGDVEVRATEELAVTCIGSGTVRYSGQPTLASRCDGSVERIE